MTTPFHLGFPLRFLAINNISFFMSDEVSLITTGRFFSALGLPTRYIDWTLMAVLSWKPKPWKSDWASIWVSSFDSIARDSRRPKMIMLFFFQMRNSSSDGVVVSKMIHGIDDFKALISHLFSSIACSKFLIFLLECRSSLSIMSILDFRAESSTSIFFSNSFETISADSFQSDSI